MDDSNPSSSKRICVVGACFTDLISYVDRLPTKGETLHCKKFSTGFGGKGANQAVQAAKLGADVMMISKVGDDAFGKETLLNFKEVGVDATYVTQVPGVASGVAPIAVDAQGNNSIIIAPGACGLLSHADMEAARPAIRSCGLLVCQLEVPMEATIAALKIAREEGLQTVLNTAPAPTDGALPGEIWSLCDVVSPNEPELRSLTGMPTSTNEEVAAAAGEVLRRGAKKVLVTLGERGCALFEAGSGFCHFVPCPKVEAKDTTGAGDSFLGACTHYLMSGETLLSSMASANEVAAVSVTREGTQKSFADSAEMAETTLTW